MINTFIERAKKNEPLIINGDGTQIRTFIYVEDLCAQLVKPIDPGLSFMPGCPITILELANKIIYLCDSSSAIQHVDALPGEVKNSICHSIYQLDERLKEMINEN